MIAASGQRVKIDGKYRNIYLSPHCDDAALSCGGTIHRQSRAGEPVLVITLFAAAPHPDAPLSSLASMLHARMGGAEDLAGVRREEDRASMAVLGAEPMALRFRDCIYRGPPEAEWYYDDMDAVLGDVHPAEDGLARDIAQALAARMAGAPDAALHVPLGVGHHVDHQIANRVGWTLLRQGWTVLFYEDYPYSEPGYLNANAGSDRYSLARTVADQPAALLPLCSEISSDDLDARIRSIHAYGSQLALIFGDPSTIAQRVSAYALRHGSAAIERFWVRKDDPGPRRPGISSQL